MPTVAEIEQRLKMNAPTTKRFSLLAQPSLL